MFQYTRGRLFVILILVIIVFFPDNVCMGSRTGKTVYVSSSKGDDRNDGKTELTALKNISAGLAKGDTVLLKSGDVFYIGNLSIENKMLSRYGNGVNPTICGYKRIKEPRWIMVDDNVWMLNLAEQNYTGFVLHGSSASNNICAFHDYERDDLHGRKVWHKTEMNQDWDFWQTETLKNAKPEEYDVVYLYLTEDPNKIKMEMSIYDCALRINNASVDGVDFVGFGFGISAGTKTIIRNCKVDAIGGRIIPEGNDYVCYGNGVEFWVNKDIEDCVVENNIISRCYDCGVTIQCSGGGQATPRNILVRNNLIDRCCQGWEDFLRNDDNVVYENCVFENNIVLNSGKTSGFGYSKSRFKYCHVLGNNHKGNKGMIIRNNIFVGGNFYCSGSFNDEYKSNVWQDNICVIRRGDFILGNYTGTKDVIRIPIDKGQFGSMSIAVDEAIRRYRILTGDMTTKFLIRRNAAINRKIKKLKKKHKVK